MNVCEASGRQPLTSDQLNPLIQLMKRISLLAALIAAAAVAAPPSAQAQSLQSSIANFCRTVVKDANGQGFSAKPGTMFASLVQARVPEYDYAMLWRLAKASGQSNCNRMY